MLNENIKKLRKSKGLSQEELAIKLNVVRQTVSKWENGLSDDLKAISEKLEVINLQLAKRSMAKVKTIRWILISVCVFIVITFIVLAAMQSSYLGWDYNNPELAVAGTIMHGFEFVFVRLAPIVFLASIIGIVIIYKKIRRNEF